MVYGARYVFILFQIIFQSANSRQSRIGGELYFHCTGKRTMCYVGESAAAAAHTNQLVFLKS